MVRVFLVVVVALACVSCTPTQTISNDPKFYQNLGTATLWSLYGSSRFEREISFIETELVRRGEVSSLGRYVGQRTQAQIGTQRFSRQASGTSSADTHNCSDFANGRAAQQFFLSAGGPQSDIHNLDRDGDGFACEWGTTVRRSAARATRPAPTRVSRPRYTARYTCHTGPRGGRYAWVNGRKDYSKC